MRLADLRRNTSVRLAVAFAGLFSAAVVAVFLLLYWQVGRDLEHRLSARLSETREALILIDLRSGFDDLTSVVASESASIRDADTILLLLDTEGQFVAGNVRDVPLFEGVRRLDRAIIPEIAQRSAAGDQLLSDWSDVSGGKLLVGVSDQDVQAMRRLILTGLAWGLLGMLVLAAIAGWVLGARTHRRVDAFAKTLNAVSFGKLEPRVPLSSRGDDLDQVGMQLNAALDRLKTLIARVNQASSDIAHELKKPIGRLRQHLEATLNHRLESSATQDAIAAAIGEADRVVDIIEAVLRISQIEAGARKSRFAPVDLAALLSNLAEVYAPVAEEAGHRLDLLTADAEAVLGDAELLTQLFANLAENAIRHCPRGTKIELSLKREPAGILARVADTGHGIASDERAKVLERFHRLDKSRTTPGTGLGLSLVAAIAELHGAHLELADNVPGLNVSLRFPPLPQQLH